MKQGELFNINDLSSQKNKMIIRLKKDYRGFRGIGFDHKSTVELMIISYNRQKEFEYIPIIKSISKEEFEGK
jgi:hypothetical protein